MSYVVKSNQKLNWFTKQVLNIIKHGAIPKHIGIMLDGSRRYARKMKITTLQGQSSCGYKLDEILEWCNYLNIRNISVFMFSLENFKRSKEELDGVMRLIEDKYQQIINDVDEYNRLGYCVRNIGDVSLFPKNIQLLMNEVYQKTSHNKCFLNMAIGYTGRDEMHRTMKVIGSLVESQEISEDDVDLEFFDQMMCNPKLDILIRSSGEVRLSDFMLWQIHDGQIFFVDVLWPEFNIWHFIICIFKYQRNVTEFWEEETYLGLNENPELSERIQKVIENYKNKQLLLN